MQLHARRGSVAAPALVLPMKFAFPLLRKPWWPVVLLLSACAAGHHSGIKTSADSRRWSIEAEDKTARVRFAGGEIDIDTPAGVSVWLRQELEGPVRISFEAMAVRRGGPNDHVSDLNAFWMARNRDGTSVLASPRSGAFATYDDMVAYYVGIGGNRNSTTRFRRYIGRSGDRPLLPQHDLSAPRFMLKPNEWIRIELVAEGQVVQVWRDGELILDFRDPEPLRAGHFALRTTKSHLKIRNVEVKR